jgi:hypothetical protein
MFAPASQAADLETLVMPGPVVAAHADIETQCEKCHSAFDRTAGNRLCRDCHEEVDADLRRGEGFHGRSLGGESGADCRSCHVEHLGRDADIVGLATGSFDHDVTDFPLEGAHERAACSGCHEAGAPRREAPSACGECHGAVDPHRGGLGADCSECHDARGWKQAGFDHAATRFPLDGAHREVDCGLCHPNARYEGTPSGCAACHAGNDAHQGRFGADCGQCHSVADWNRATFNHGVETGFALTGRHGKARCEACHAGGRTDEDLPEDCFGCHRNDDDHRGGNGTLCEDCHSTAGWSEVSFDHGRDTDFALEGAHVGLDCGLCHRGTLGREDLSGDCAACHAADDDHEGTLGSDCQGCHTTSTWDHARGFDHGLTGFPLLGIHSVTSCSECHAGGRYPETEASCAACHADDAHAGRLGDECARCHTPNGWPLWQFDHATETAFALHGAHGDLECRACHTQPATGRVRAATRCVACHARDDPHSGRLGRRCESCHRETEWEEVTR